jgi:hypothetical protein
VQKLDINVKRWRMRTKIQHTKKKKKACASISNASRIELPFDGLKNRGGHEERQTRNMPRTDKSGTLSGYKLQLVIASCHDFSRRSDANGVSTILPQLNQNGKKARKPLSSKYDPARVGPFQCSIYGRRPASSQPMSQSACRRNCITARTGSASLNAAYFADLAGRGNDVPKGELYERPRNLGRDSIKSTPRDPARPIPPFIVLIEREREREGERDSRFLVARISRNLSVFPRIFTL